MHVLTIAAVVLLGVGSLVTVGNWVGVAHAWWARVGFSCVPILGGLSACVGLLLIPRVRPFAFIPLLADFGCMPMVLALLVHVLRKHRDVPASRG
jgi:hypothetical protein